MLLAVAVEVQQAVVAAGGAVAVAVVASVPAVLAKRSAGRAEARTEDLDAKIGTPNGDGDVVQMLTTLIRGQAEDTHRIARLEGGQHDLRTDVAHLNGRVDVLERQRSA